MKIEYQVQLNVQFSTFSLSYATYQFCISSNRPQRIKRQLYLTVQPEQDGYVERDNFALTPMSIIASFIFQNLSRVHSLQVGIKKVQHLIIQFFI